MSFLDGKELCGIAIINGGSRDLPHLDLSRAIFTKPNLWTEWLTILGVGLFFVSRKSFVNSENSLTSGVNECSKVSYLPMAI